MYCVFVGNGGLGRGDEEKKGEEQAQYYCADEEKSKVAVGNDSITTCTKVI